MPNATHPFTENRLRWGARIAAVVCLAADALLFTRHFKLRETIVDHSRAAAQEAAAQAADGIEAELAEVAVPDPAPDLYYNIGL